MEVDVTYVFDEILGRHMERLLGSRFGIGGLQLRIGSIACLTLLAYPEPQDGQTAAEGTTVEVLKQRLDELGMRDKEKVEPLIQDMIEKGYILVDDQGKISGGKPASSMAQVLERLFPKLTGNTLVAYFIQTIEEVLSGRKAMEAAVAQFDQALKMQGVPLKTPKAEKPSQVQRPASKKKEASSEEVQKSIQEALMRNRETVPEEGGFRIIGSEGSSFNLKDIRKAPLDLPSTPREEAKEEKCEKKPEAPCEDMKVETSVSAESPDHTSAGISPSAPLVEQPPSPLVEQEEPEDLPPETQELQEPPSDGTIATQENAPAEDELALEETTREEVQGPEPAEMETLPPQENEPQPKVVEEVPEIAPPEPEQVEAADESADDAIEKEISSFQEDLAALCPLCKDGKVREQKTGTGRVYYKCSNRACSLVSWGKPHHIACPNCKNPFLIEVSVVEGNIRLRCPRATCNYQCTISADAEIPAKGATSPGGEKARKPRRRVVRRRVVRRKK